MVKIQFIKQKNNVKINNILSDLITFTYKIFQGNVLGPLLFLIYML